MAKQQRHLIVSTVSCFELGEFASLVLGQLERKTKHMRKVCELSGGDPI